MPRMPRCAKTVHQPRRKSRQSLVCEPLEDRTLPAGLPSFHFDFGTASSPVATGYQRMALSTYSAAKGYGWMAVTGMTAMDRGTSNALMRDFAQGQSNAFWVDLPNGVYDVTFTLGDPSKARDKIDLRAEGLLLTSNVSTSAGQTYRGTFTVTVTDARLNVRLIDNGGVSTTWAFDALDVAPNPGPTANAGADQSGKEGTEVQFAGTATGNGTLSYKWDFGDGSTATGTLTPKHTYADNGTYTAKLTVTDGFGLSNSDTAVVTVANVSPTPNAGGPYSGTAGSSLGLSGAATDPSTADTAAGFTWLWNFGDGSTSTQQNPGHTYANSGTYAVTLTATDKDGGSATTTTSATISSSNSGDDWIITPDEKIPNYGKNPTISSVRSGLWSDIATWSLGRLPTTGDVVSIGANTVVTYDVDSTARLTTIVVKSGGELTFRTDVSTRVIVTNLLVLEGGALTVGTTANPVAAGVTAQIIIANQAVDTAYDPQQYGTGLIGLGKVTMCGAVRSDSFMRLAAEPLAGQQTLTLAQPVTGWQVGNKLFLPDSRQLHDYERGANYTLEAEEVYIQSISADGKTITLTTPLKYDHPGARTADGVLTFLPHVGNLSRNVIVRSESATGYRGHVLFTNRADVDIRYTQFSGLGRTKNDAFDDTTFNADGTVSHVGTNQSGRYPVNFRNLMGPVTTPADGQQFTFIGNSIFCPLNPMPFRWGLVISNSHYGLIRDNVMYNWAGAGLVTETGNESYNTIEDNFVARISGTGGRLDQGRDGDGFWLRGPNNYVRNNVASTLNAVGGSGASSYGFNYFMYYLGNVKIPTAKGASESNYVTVDMNTVPIMEFTGNEAYGAMPGGLTFWHIGTFGDWPTGQITGDSLFKNFRVWNHFDVGVFGYPSDRVIFDGLTILGNASIVSNPYEGVTGVTFSDYPTQNLIIRNADIENMQVGIEMPYVAPGITTVRDSFFRNVTDLVFRTMYSVNGSANLPPRKSMIINDRFAAMPGLNHLSISMTYDTGHGNNLIKKDEVFVYDYNGNVGENYQVYYQEQAASFVVPQSSGTLIGSPDAGLTNQQNWDKYGIAIGGAIAPASASSRSDMHGLVVRI